MFYVQYEVEGFEGIQEAGPYSIQEVTDQKNDIEGYEGVKNVRIISAEDKFLQE